jgi:hypothetical protein
LRPREEESTKEISKAATPSSHSVKQKVIKDDVILDVRNDEKEIELRTQEMLAS